MARSHEDDMNNALEFLIQKNRDAAEKKQLLTDFGVINDVNLANKDKVESYERLIKYISHLESWEEEVLTYLGNNFAKIKTDV